MMNPDIKKRWVDALRSGGYEQGEGYLCRYGQYCCLGVLCDTIKDDINIKIDKDYDEYVLYDGCWSTLSKDIEEYCGLDVSCTDINYKGESTDLTELNDFYRLPFNEIADIIEEQL